MTHPPCSKPPRRSSSAPPNPCITPSTVTLVVVVSFMVADSFSLGFVHLGAPRGRPLTPTTNNSAPIRHRLPDFCRRLSATPVVIDPTGQTVSGRLRRI